MDPSIDWRTLKIPEGLPSIQKLWLARITRKIQINNNGCWIWMGTMLHGAVPVAKLKLKEKEPGIRVAVHRKLWELLKRGGLRLDPKEQISRCPYNPRCVLPAHHEPRKWGSEASRDRALKEKCGRGHSMEDAYVDGRGYRSCRTCRKEATRRYWKKLKDGYDQYITEGVVTFEPHVLVPVKPREEKIEKPPATERKPMKAPRTATPGGSLKDYMTAIAWVGEVHRRWRKELSPKEASRRIDRMTELGNYEALMAMSEEKFEELMQEGTEDATTEHGDEPQSGLAGEDGGGEPAPVRGGVDPGLLGAPAERPRPVLGVDAPVGRARRDS